MNFDNGFHLIFDIENLRKLVSFLESGFGWKHEKSLKIINYFKQQTNEFPKGAIYLDNGEIAIGILFFYQGFNKYQKKHVINLSSWYSKESHRAIEVLKFANNFTKALEKYIITDYTPSFKTSKILKAMKYNDMSVKKMVLGLTKSPPFFTAKIPFQFLTLKKNILTEPLNIEKNNKKINKSLWLYKLHEINKLGILFSVITIIGYRENFKLSFFWLLKMIIRHRILKINIIINDNETPPSTVWLIKNSNNELYVSPENSELEI